MSFKIKGSDRLSVIGRTGSGKTTLFLALIRAWIYQTRNWNPYHIIILDTKKDGDFNGIGRKFYKLKDLSRLWHDFRILIYEPHESEMNEAGYNGLIKWLRDTEEPFLLVIDELSSLGKGNDMPEQYDLLMKQGRGKFQVAWAGIQNPVYVPHDFLSNANHYFCFDLLMESDRKKMASIIGDDVLIPPIERDGKAEHGFYYFTVSKRGTVFYPNNPPISIPLPEGFNPKGLIRFDGRGETENMGRINLGLVWAVLLLALLMVFTIPVWKLVFKWASSKVSILKPVDAWVSNT
jgi:energy-coupling factor transporter ATP-binding protein EcfA2